MCEVHCVRYFGYLIIKLYWFTITVYVENSIKILIAWCAELNFLIFFFLSNCSPIRKKEKEIKKYLKLLSF